jgi:hypothetical protein
VKLGKLLYNYARKGEKMKRDEENNKVRFEGCKTKESDDSPQIEISSLRKAFKTGWDLSRPAKGGKRNKKV